MIPQKATFFIYFFYYKSNMYKSKFVLQASRLKLAGTTAANRH